MRVLFSKNHELMCFVLTYAQLSLLYMHISAQTVKYYACTESKTVYTSAMTEVVVRKKLKYARIHHSYMTLVDVPPCTPRLKPFQLIEQRFFVAFLSNLFVYRLVQK
jgi:hypothetical protein